MIIAVIDGMGGGIGVQIVTQIRQELPLDVETLALGSNAVATDRMMQARANRGASGENAIRVSVNLADFVLGPIGIVIPNSMMGEITPQLPRPWPWHAAANCCYPLTNRISRSSVSNGVRLPNRSAPRLRQFAPIWTTTNMPAEACRVLTIPRAKAYDKDAAA